MMKNEIKYRLSEYIIIEYGGFLLNWMSHTALAMELSGRCFIIGNILVIGPTEHKEAGLLKLEFHEQLKKSPPWIKTKFYCFASTIQKIDTEQNITNDLIKHPYIPKIDMETEKTNGPSTFRLGRYKITVDENDIISWQTIGELNRIISGKCITESEILFIGAKENEFENGQSRRDFFAGQKLLTQWDKTFAWGHYGSLMKCKEPYLRRSFAAIWTPESVKACITNKMLLSKSKEFSIERFHEFTVSGTEWLKTKWHCIVEWKIWGRLAPLIMAVVLIGVQLFVFLIGKCASISLRIIDRFREHNKE